MVNENFNKIEEYIKAFYSENITNEELDELSPDKEDLIQVFKEKGLEKVLSFLNKDSMKKLNKSLNTFNKNYEPAVQLIKKDLDKDNVDYSKPLFLLYNIWLDSHFITIPFQCTRKDKRMSDISWNLIYGIHPSWIAPSEVALATHILNKSFEKIGLEYLKNYKELGFDMSNLTKILPEFKKCKEYLKELPPSVTIQNMVRFYELPKEYSIPSISGNQSSNISRKLFDKIGIKWK